MEKVKNAVLALDVNNDAHWTQTGLPNINYLKIVSATPDLTREMVEAAVPGYNRQTAQNPVPEQVPQQTDGTGAQVVADNIVQQLDTGTGAEPLVVTQQVTEQLSTVANSDEKSGENDEFASLEEERESLLKTKEQLELQIAELMHAKSNVVSRLDEIVLTTSQSTVSMTEMIQRMHKRDVENAGLQTRTIVEQKYPIDRPKAKK